MWNPSPWAEQQGSYAEPVTPPTADVCDEPRVCLSMNVQYLALLAGAAQQLMQPTTWDVADQAALNLVLDRMTDLIAIIGTAVPCNTTPPPIGGGTAQRACNIAGYIANVVIKSSIDKAVQAITDGQTLLGYGSLIIGLIPGAGLVINGLIQGLSDLYNTINGGTLADYSDAVNDATLFSAITCAIYAAISTDGAVTDGNFPTLVGNVTAVSYVHAEVIPTIVDYLNDLGASGVESLQNTGALADYDCTNCGTTGATGPPALPPLADAGTVSITIPTGSAQNSATVLFHIPFATAPVVTVSSDSQDVIVDATAVDADSFVATITSAVDVIADLTALVSWMAVVEGAL